MKVQVLILLATTLAISCSLSEKEVFVESGSAAVLPCVVHTFNAHSSAVHWKKAVGNELKTVWRRDRSGLEFRPVGRGPRAHCPQPNFGMGDYSLHIEGVRVEDGGMYYCIVEGKEGNTANVKVILRVVRVAFSPTEVVEGNDLTITCSITPQPGSMVTTWELNGSQEPSRTSIQTLKRSNVSQKESGIWSCLVRRRTSEEVQLKASASLQVKGILNPKNNPTVVYAEVGSSVTLPCIFSGELISDTWKKVSTTTSLSVSLPPSFKTSSGPVVTQWDRSVYIDTVEEADQGMYKCAGQMKSADGKGVSVERNIQLVIAQIQRSSRSGQLTLTCDISDTNQVTQYEWLRLDNGENATNTLTPLQKSTSKVFTIPKGEANNLGGWVCRFYSHERLLGNATYHQEMMSSLKGQNESGSSKKVITVIGLSLLLMLVLLILLQIYKNHRRKKMIMQYPAMETIVHLASNERERRERCTSREKALKASCSADMTSTSV